MRTFHKIYTWFWYVCVFGVLLNAFSGGWLAVGGEGDRVAGWIVEVGDAYKVASYRWFERTV